MVICLSLEELYKVKPWPMRPDDPKAQARFENISKLSFLLESHQFFEFLRRKRVVRVLDVMGGSGIAGAALAKGLALKNFEVELTVSDARGSDLQLVHEWLKGVDGVKAETLTADVSKMDVALPDRREYYDIALLWGLSTPHLNPWDMVRAYAAICHLLNDSGVMAMDETDRIYNIFYRVGYKDFLIEGETKDGLTVATIHMGYDEKLGVFNRTTYTLPGFKKIATFGYRFWDLAGISSLGWLFFEDVDIISPTAHKIQGLTHIILLTRPRRKISAQDLKIDPTLLRT